MRLHFTSQLSSRQYVRQRRLNCLLVRTCQRPRSNMALGTTHSWQHVGRSTLETQADPKPTAVLELSLEFRNSMATTTRSFPVGLLQRYQTRIGRFESWVDRSSGGSRLDHTQTERRIYSPLLSLKQTWTGLHRVQRQTSLTNPLLGMS